MASRSKVAEPFTSKNSDEVAQIFQKIYKRSPLTWPQLLHVVPGREFMGAVTKLMENHKTRIRRERVEIHLDQAIVQRFNCTLGEQLFGYQYAVEMRLPEGQRSTAWVQRLPRVVAALNNEVTSLTGKKIAVAIKEKSVYAKLGHRHLIQGLWGKGKNPPPTCPSPLPLPIRRVGRRCQTSHRPNLVF